MKFKQLALALTLSGLVSASFAADITFDSGLINTQIITNGYAGLDWTNFRARDTSGLTPSGFTNGTVSADFVAYSKNGAVSAISSNTPFQLVSGYFTATYLDGLQLTVTGYSGGTQVGSSVYSLDSTGPMLINFGFGTIDKVTFAATGGTNHGWGGSQATFVLDNLKVAAVPEPETYAMLLSGLALIGAISRRRRLS